MGNCKYSTGRESFDRLIPYVARRHAKIACVTRTVVAQSEISDASAAGRELGSKIVQTLGADPPDALIVFAAPSYTFDDLLGSLTASCHPKLLVGCSSAGEFTDDKALQSAACAVAIVSDEMSFAAGVAENVAADRAASARKIVTSFRGFDSQAYEYRSTLILTDALAGFTEDLLEQITLLTGGRYQLFGGGAGDEERFQRTHVFCGTRALTNAAVALEILSKKPVGIGVSHGWHPAADCMRVTESEGMRVISLNSVPAVEVFEEYAELTGQHFDRADPVPFFLHNVLGIDTGSGYKLRVPLGVDAQGAVTCAAEIPEGSLVSIMQTSNTSASNAASTAAASAISQMRGNQPSVALFFDCAATRLRMGQEFGIELDAIGRALQPARYAGCNTYGQIARVDGQFSGFHNCTAVVCVLPG